MAKRQIKRLLTTIPFKAGERLTIPLQASRRVLKEVEIRIEGDIEFAASGVSAQPGGVFNLLEEVELVVSGFDPAVSDRVQQEVRCSLGGRYFGMTGGASTTPNTEPRFNVVNPFQIIRPNSGQFVDVVPTNTDKQHFYFSAVYPFELANGINPADMRLDLANMQFVDLRLKMAKGGDVVTAAVSGEVSDCNVEIYVVELEQADIPDFSPNADLPQAYLRHYVENVVVSGDNSDLVQELNLNGNLLQAAFFCYNAAATDLNDGDNQTDNETDDWYLRHIRVQRQANVFYDKSTAAIRRENAETFANLPTTLAGGSFFANSGIFVVAPAYEPFDRRTHLSRAPFLGVGDNSAQFRLSVQKPDAGNMTLAIVKSEVITSAALAAASRRWADMTDGQRGLAQAARARTEAISQEIQNRARNSGVSVVS